jgi:hypothetical protein
LILTFETIMAFLTDDDAARWRNPELLEKSATA